MSENLAGTYRTLTWRMNSGSAPRVPPGSVVQLSHEDASQSLAMKTVLRCEPEAAEGAQEAPAAAASDATPAPVPDESPSVKDAEAAEARARAEQRAAIGRRGK